MVEQEMKGKHCKIVLVLYFDQPCTQFEELTHTSSHQRAKKKSLHTYYNLFGVNFGLDVQYKYKLQLQYKLYRKSLQCSLL